MCLIVALLTVFTFINDVRILGVISGRYGGGAMMALILFTGWYGLRVMRHNQNPEEVMRWASLSLSGDARARPEDALIPLVRVFAGFLMLIPGPITDLLGLALLSPILARPLARTLMSKGAGQIGGSNPFGGMGGGNPFTHYPKEDADPSAHEQDPVIQGRRRRGQASKGDLQRGSHTIIDVDGEVITKKEDEER